MITPINIDLSGLVQEFAIPEDDIKQFTSNVISEVATEYAMYWRNAANDLGQTRTQYQNSIYTEKINDTSYIVGLMGELPNMLEQGADAFDMKKGFENSDKKTIKEDGGWYLTIPFKFGVPTSNPDNPAFTGGILPSEVYEKAIDLDEGQPLRKKDLPEEFQKVQTRKKIVTKSKVFEEYKRKTARYEGIYRKNDPYSSNKRGQYVSFRRVSDNSDPNSWIHPGLEAKNFSEKAFDNMDLPSTLDKIVEKYINQL